jgi:hypothetical protein
MLKKKKTRVGKLHSIRFEHEMKKGEKEVTIGQRIEKGNSKEQVNIPLTPTKITKQAFDLNNKEKSQTREKG